MRYALLSPQTLTPEQKAVYDSIAATRKGAVPTPFHIFLQSPELADRAQQLGSLLRYRTGLTPRQSEIAILVTAKHWNEEYEWSVHAPEARKAGVPEDAIDAIRTGTRPASLSGDDALIYDFAHAFYANLDVPDRVFDLAVARLGHKTVVELSSILGYYSMLAIVMRVYRVKP
jgi:4-carboxymuconolactone decarboxylase